MDDSNTSDEAAKEAADAMAGEAAPTVSDEARPADETSSDDSGTLSDPELETEASDAGTVAAEADSEVAEEASAPAQRFLDKWQSGSIPFLNKPFLKFVQVALVLGAAAVLVDNFFVDKEVREGVEFSTYVDSFDRGDFAQFGSQMIGKLTTRYQNKQQWVEYSGGFGTKATFAQFYAISQDEAVLLDAPRDGGAAFATVGALAEPEMIEARFTVPAEDAGLVFRSSDANNWWAVTALPTKGRLVVIRTVKGQTEQVGSTDDNAFLGGNFLVQIRLDGDGFTIYVEGSPVLRVDDDTLATSRAKNVGLIGMSKKAVGARWDDFVLRELTSQVRGLQPPKISPSDTDGDVVVPDYPDPATSTTAVDSNGTVSSTAPAGAVPTTAAPAAPTTVAGG